MDAVHACSSGHLGLPLGAAEIGAVLYGSLMRHDPSDSHWINRDIFVLSAGHGSMFLYSWLHLAGYPLSLDEVKRFRQWDSKTPGHPEWHHTEGVEATTGPLGQGVGNAVGHAVAAKMLAAAYNTPEHTIFDQTVWCLAGDGCLQEGVAAEAASFAGHFKLDNLVILYDSNDVTLDAMADKTQSESVAGRFAAYGFEVFRVEEGNDLEQLHATLEAARTSKSGKPRFVEVRTLIGKGIPEVAGTAKAHGESGAKFIDQARKALGLPAEHFFVSDEVRAYFAAHGAHLKTQHEAWQKTYDAWRGANLDKASALDRALHNARNAPAGAHDTPRFIRADAEYFSGPAVRCDAVSRRLHSFRQETVIGDPVLKVVGVRTGKLSTIIVERHPVLRAATFEAEVMREGIKPEIASGKFFRGAGRIFRGRNHSSVSASCKHVDSIVLSPLQAV